MQHVAHRGSDPRPPVLRRAVRPDDRDFGVPSLGFGAKTAEEVAKSLTRREREILARLLQEVSWDGIVWMITRGEIGTGEIVMRRLWGRGWVNGGGSPDARGTGNTSDSSWWWLTTKGEAIARATAAKEAGT